MENEIYHIATKRSGHAWTGYMIQSWCPGVSYTERENMPLSTFVKPPGTCVVILQTRDLLNWYASYYQARKVINKKVVAKVTPKKIAQLFPKKKSR